MAAKGTGEGKEKERMRKAPITDELFFPDNDSAYILRETRRLEPTEGSVSFRVEPETLCF